MYLCTLKMKSVYKVVISINTFIHYNNGKLK